MIDTDVTEGGKKKKKKKKEKKIPHYKYVLVYSFPEKSMINVNFMNLSELDSNK